MRINEDVALLKAIMLMMLEAETQQPGTVFDRAFIEAHTSGYDYFIKSLKQHSVDACIAQTGVDKAAIEAAAEMIAQKKRLSFAGQWD